LAWGRGVLSLEIAKTKNATFYGNRMITSATDLVTAVFAMAPHSRINAYFAMVIWFIFNPSEEEKKIIRHIYIMLQGFCDSSFYILRCQIQSWPKDF
jgi:hypothetical protein